MENKNNAGDFQTIFFSGSAVSENFDCMIFDTKTKKVLGYCLLYNLPQAMVVGK